MVSFCGILGMVDPIMGGAPHNSVFPYRCKVVVFLLYRCKNGCVGFRVLRKGGEVGG